MTRLSNHLDLDLRAGSSFLTLFLNTKAVRTRIMVLVATRVLAKLACLLLSPSPAAEKPLSSRRAYPLLFSSPYPFPYELSFSLSTTGFFSLPLVQTQRYPNQTNPHTPDPQTLSHSPKCVISSLFPPQSARAFSAACTASLTPSCINTLLTSLIVGAWGPLSKGEVRADTEGRVRIRVERLILRVFSRLCGVSLGG